MELRASRKRENYAAFFFSFGDVFCKSPTIRWASGPPSPAGSLIFPIPLMICADCQRMPPVKGLAVAFLVGAAAG